jgi:hypothetical protein
VVLIADYLWIRISLATQLCGVDCGFSLDWVRGFTLILSCLNGLIFVVMKPVAVQCARRLGRHELAIGSYTDWQAHNARLGINRGGFGGSVSKYTLHLYLEENVDRLTINCQLPNSVRKIVVQQQQRCGYSVQLVLKWNGGQWQTVFSTFR